jgi:hypothetical protein
VFHQVAIDDFIVDLVTNRLLILRELIVLIFHHSIISQGACDARPIASTACVATGATLFASALLGGGSPTGMQSPNSSQPSVAKGFALMLETACDDFETLQRLIRRK